MKKLWSYISAVLAGVVIGIILWEKVDYKTVYNGRVKIKQKGEGHTSEITVPITVKEARKAKRERRKQKRDARKDDKSSSTDS